MPPGRRPSPAKIPEPQPGFIAVGWVRSVHGLNGELKITRLSDNPERFQPDSILWAKGEQYTVRGVRGPRGALLLQLDGIDTRTQAEAMRNLLLEVPEKELGELGEGEYYRFQVLGLEVVDGEGNLLGRIAEVLDTGGANDVYLVENDEGELLIPAIDSVIVDVDIEGRRMMVEPLEGMERRPRPREKR